MSVSCHKAWCHKYTRVHRQCLTRILSGWARSAVETTLSSVAVSSYMTKYNTITRERLSVLCKLRNNCGRDMMFIAYV